jgi:hypothetical protein
MNKIKLSFIIILLLIPFKIVPRLFFGFLDSDKILTNSLILIFVSILSFNSDVYGEKLTTMNKIIYVFFSFVILQTLLM